MAVILAWCAISLYAMVYEAVGPHPSDREMLNNFQKHKTEFDQLLQMFIADQQLESVAHQWTSPTDLQLAGITPQRLEEYNALIWKINLRIDFCRLAIRPCMSLWKVYGQTGLDAVEFSFSSRGLAVSGSVKGYIYTFKSPSPIVDNLDKYTSESGKFTVYRHIEENWYLYYYVY
jgi:hypothetical protein